MFKTKSPRMARPGRWATIIALAAALNGCFGDSTASPTALSDDPARIELSESSLRLLVGNSFTLQADVFTADGRPAPGGVEWSVNAPSVVSVDASGRVLALGGGSATVTATSGGVTAQAAVTVPQPVAQISSSGGSVETPDQKVSLTIPESAVSSSVAISVQAALTDSLPQGSQALTGSAFEFGPAGLHFDPPATLSLAYEPSLVTESEALRLCVHKLVNGQWVPVPGSVDTDAHRVSAEITSFSIYAIAAVPNQAPTVAITAPADESAHELASEVAFAGQATDPEEGALTGTRLVWSSSLDGELGTGSELKLSDLSLGQHVVMLTATDGEGAQGMAAIGITISDPPPQAEIIAPADGSGIKTGESVTFEGTGSDAVDGALTGSALAWTSSVDGALGTGEELTTSTLSEATHIIVLTVTNSRGVTGADSITFTVDPNAPPSVKITSPSDGAHFELGSSIRFEGSADDPEDGAISGAALTWTSDRAGHLGEGASLQRSDLSLGVHQITLTAVDSNGGSASATVSLTVYGVPQLSITSPDDGTEVVQGETLDFSAAASDPEDGDLSGSSVAWTSSRDGALGTGTAISTSGLSLGRHTVTVTATDSDGRTGSAAISVSIQPPAPTLVSPTEGQLMDNGCYGWTDPKVWDFDWEDVQGADQYQIYVIGANASIPAVDTEVSGSSYRDDGNSYIIDANRHGWTWRVRAKANGVWGPWSETRSFDAEPVNTDCPGPNLISPAPGAVLDNGCSIASDTIQWNFDWTDVADATAYHLYVMGANASIPVINNNQLTSSDYSHVREGSHIIEQHRFNWTWKVRAFVGGGWGDWSEERIFHVEPLNTDCGG